MRLHGCAGAARAGHAQVVHDVEHAFHAGADRALVEAQRFTGFVGDHRDALGIGHLAQDGAQLAAAQASKAALEKTKPFPAPVVTQILTGAPFYRAEEYHQDYYKKNPLRYSYYRSGCGRDARLKQLWGAAGAKP